MSEVLPYVALFLGLLATIGGVLSKTDGKINRTGGFLIFVAVCSFTVAVAILFFAPPNSETRLSERFGVDGWFGQIEPGESATVLSTCDFDYLRDESSNPNNTYDRMPYILDEIWQWEGRFAIEVDSQQRRLVRITDFPEGLNESDVNDLVLQAFAHARRIYDERKEGYKVQGMATPIDAIVDYSTLTIFFPSAVFGERSNCSGRITISKVQG